MDSEMKYSIDLLQRQANDHLATANAIELRMGRMLEPRTEAAVDVVRKHRLRAEELRRAIAILKSSNIENIEDLR